MAYLLPYLRYPNLICTHCIDFSIVLLTVCLFIPCVTLCCCCLCCTALLYLGQVAVVNENLFSSGLPGLNKGEIKTKKIRMWPFEGQGKLQYVKEKGTYLFPTQYNVSATCMFNKRHLKNIAMKQFYCESARVSTGIHLLERKKRASQCIERAAFRVIAQAIIRVIFGTPVGI